LKYSGISNDIVSSGFHKKGTNKKVKWYLPGESFTLDKIVPKGKSFYPVKTFNQKKTFLPGEKFFAG